MVVGDLGEYQLRVAGGTALWFPADDAAEACRCWAGEEEEAEGRGNAGQKHSG